MQTDKMITGLEASGRCVQAFAEFLKSAKPKHLDALRRILKAFERRPKHRGECNDFEPYAMEGAIESMAMRLVPAERVDTAFKKSARDLGESLSCAAYRFYANKAPAEDFKAFSDFLSYAGDPCFGSPLKIMRNLIAKDGATAECPYFLTWPDDDMKPMEFQLSTDEARSCAGLVMASEARRDGKPWHMNKPLAVEAEESNSESAEDDPEPEGDADSPNNPDVISQAEIADLFRREYATYDTFLAIRARMDAGATVEAGRYKAKTENEEHCYVSGFGNGGVYVSDEGEPAESLANLAETLDAAEPTDETGDSTARESMEEMFERLKAAEGEPPEVMIQIWDGESSSVGFSIDEHEFEEVATTIRQMRRGVHVPIPDREELERAIVLMLGLTKLGMRVQRMVAGVQERQQEAGDEAVAAFKRFSRFRPAAIGGAGKLKRSVLQAPVGLTSWRALFACLAAISRW